MKVLQLIDSLEAGGAERVAVNFANALVSKIDESFICASRDEGILKSSLKKEVGYLFLNKKHALDFSAVKRLKQFIIEHDITIVHAHSSSFFMAWLTKLIYPKFKIVWHDHYGNRPNASSFKNRILKLCTSSFSAIITVSEKLKQWAEDYLKANKVTYLPNYPQSNSSIKSTVLNGIEGKRILCLANLRPDKNHGLLLESFKTIIGHYPEWTLHLIGKDNNDEYSQEIKKLIKDLELKSNVFLYGSSSDTTHIIQQSNIGVLSSKSEGLPLVLLEYGLAGLPTITTNVGQCAKVILDNKTGLVVEPNDSQALFNAIKMYIDDYQLALTHSIALKKHINTHYSKETTINKLLTLYKTISIK